MSSARFLSSLALSLVISAGLVLPSMAQSAASVTSVASAQQSDLKQSLDAAIDGALANKKIVGTVVVVARDGKIVYRRAAGLADREANLPVKLDTIFRLASMTKPIVSTAAVSLIQAGKLKLDDPVKKYLPDFQPKLSDGSTPVITVRELLTHTSGLDYRFSDPLDGPYHKANVSDGLDQPGLSMDENLKRIASCPLLFSPGTNWHYSLSIDVLGAVLEKAAGKPLPEIVKERVTGPLQMGDTDFVVTDKSRLAVPYADGKEAPTRMKELENMRSRGSDFNYVPARAFDPKSYPSGGAGMVGTADDYIKLLEAIRTDDSRLLDSKLMHLLKLNQIGDLKDQYSPGWGFGYASGVLFEHQKKYPYSVGTLEWGGAYGCHWFMDPVEKLSVVEMSNTALEGLGGKYAKDVTNAVYGVRAGE